MSYATMHDQVGNDLTSIHIEACQVSKTAKSTVLQHGLAFIRAVQAHHERKEKAFCTAHRIESIVEFQDLWHWQAVFSCRCHILPMIVNKPFPAHEMDALGPSFHKRLVQGRPFRGQGMVC